MADAHRAGVLRDPLPIPIDVTGALRRDLDTVSDAAGAGLPDDVLVAAVAGWSQLFGLVGFELSGQTHAVIHEHAALLDATLRLQAAAIGLPGR